MDKGVRKKGGRWIRKRVNETEIGLGGTSWVTGETKAFGGRENPGGSSLQELKKSSHQKLVSNAAWTFSLGISHTDIFKMTQEWMFGDPVGGKEKRFPYLLSNN